MIFHIVYFPPWANKTHTHTHTHTCGEKESDSGKATERLIHQKTRQDNDYKHRGRDYFNVAEKSRKMKTRIWIYNYDLLFIYWWPWLKNFSREVKWSEITSLVSISETLWTVACQAPPFRIFQGRILEWAAVSFSRGSFQPRDWTWFSRIAGRLFTIWTTREFPLIERWRQDWMSSGDN